MHKFAPWIALLVAVTFGAVVQAQAADAGSSAIGNHRTAWLSTSAYRVGAVVTYNGADYICVISNTAVAPTANSHEWRALSTAAVAPPTAARSNESVITSLQANEIISELRAIRQLLEKGVQAAAPVAAVEERVSLTLRDSPVLGSPEAPFTLMEFADYQCPFCRRFHMTVFDDIKKNYIDTGKLRYISRDLPLPMHDHATQAANAARCADEQHQFWAMRHQLMTTSQKLGHDELVAYARALHLDVDAFTGCLDQNRYDATVQRDAADAAQIGVTGTPSFVLGATVKDGRFQGVKIVGAQSYAVFDEKIRAMVDRH